MNLPLEEVTLEDGRKTRSLESHAKDRRTHCKNGHELTEDNIIIRICNDRKAGDGGREKHICKTCYYERHPLKKNENACKRGHSYENNVRYKKNKDGSTNYNSKVCLTCERERRTK